MTKQTIPSRTKEGTLLTECILEVFKLNGALLDAGNRLTSPYELSSAKWQVMGAVSRVEDSQTVAAIAREMGLTRQSVQRIINDLVKVDIVEMRHNPDHKRAKRTTLTAKGQHAIANIGKDQIKWVNELSQGTHTDEFQTALRVLKSVTVKLNNSQNSPEGTSP